MAHRKAFDFIEFSKRSPKPRKKGLTMVLDKGLSVGQARHLACASEYIDIVKFGWATPCLMDEAFIKEKAETYNRLDISISNGGTLLEISHSQNKLECACHLALSYTPWVIHR